MLNRLLGFARMVGSRGTTPTTQPAPSSLAMRWYTPLSQDQQIGKAQALHQAAERYATKPLSESLRDPNGWRDVVSHLEAQRAFRGDGFKDLTGKLPVQETKFSGFSLVEFMNGEAYIDLRKSGELGSGISKKVTAAIRYDDARGVALSRAHSSWTSSVMEREVEVSNAVGDRDGVRPVEAFGSQRGASGEVALLVQPLMPDTLSAMSSRQPKRTEILDVAIGALKGLEAMHDAGYNHRDVWSDNILIDDQGQGVLVDFGMSTNRDLRAHGHPHYAHPAMRAESAKSSGMRSLPSIEAGKAADVYGLGLTLGLLGPESLALSVEMRSPPDALNDADTADDALATLAKDHAERLAALRDNPNALPEDVVFAEMRNPVIDDIESAASYRKRLEAIRATCGDV